MAYFSSITQTETVSTNNSSTSNIVAAATFTGTGESCLSSAGIHVSFKSDQLCTIYIDQSSDNSNWDVSDSYLYKAAATNFGITIQTISSYFRIRITNNGSAITTYFRLQTILCSFVEAIPRSLDSKGNLKSSINALNDNFGFSGQFSPIRDLKTTEPYRLVGTTFGSSNDATFWTLANSGTGSASTVASSMSTLTSGTANNGYGQITSVRSGRFMFAHPHVWRGAIRLTATTATNNTRRFGAFSLTATVTPNDGFYFEVDGAGVLSVCTVTGTTTTKVASGSFNGDISHYTMDTNVHAYEIVYFVMGAWFYVDNILVHKVTPTVSQMSSNYSLPCTSTSINSASGTASGILEVWSMSIIRWGKDITAPISNFFPAGQTAGTQLKIGAGNLRQIILSDVSNSSVITLVDNTTGSSPVIWTVTPGAINSALVIDLKDLPFFTGLRLVVAAANSGVLTIFE